MKNGMRITVPDNRTLAISDKKSSPYKKKFSKEYLSELKALEHKNFIEVSNYCSNLVQNLGNTTQKVNVNGVSYGDAVNKLHDQLRNLDLDGDRFKVRHKRRRF